MSNEIKTAGEPAEPIINDAELKAAEEQAIDSPDTYTHIFRKPFTFEGDTYTELTFDWGALTAEDSLAIEDELAARGKIPVAPEFSADYLLHMAARACVTRGESGKRLGADAFKKLPLADFNRIRGRARGFLLRWGS